HELTGMQRLGTTCPLPSFISGTLLQAPTQALKQPGPPLLAELEAIDKALHPLPELPMQDLCSAAILARAMPRYGYKLLPHIGVAGVVSLMKNGTGPAGMLRALNACLCPAP
ncbi:hypothetical protein, partial [Bordetella holmesii]|uniref:hypothetical protein n=2 Tax=Bordetella holmesii TaxID=35814 RepID=UPI001F607FF7